MNPLLQAQAALAGIVVAIAIPVLLLVAAFAPPHTESGRFALGFFLVFFVLFAPFCWWLHRRSQGWLELDDTGVRQFDGTREVTVRWEEIERVDYRRFAKRLKVFARDGRVAGVEQQLVGFEEAMRAIAARTGRSIADLPAIARLAAEPVEGTLRVGPPPGFLYVVWLATLAGAWFFCIGVARHGWWSAAVGACVVYWLNRNLRAEAARAVTLDDRGLRYRDIERDVAIARETIRSCRMEVRDGAVWLTLRDGGNNVLLQLTRGMFRITGTQTRGFDALAAEAVRRFGSPG